MSDVDAQVEAGAPVVEPSDIGTALVRTVVPIVVTLVVNLLARWGLEVDDMTRALLANLVSVLVGAGYYVVARELERRWPRAGWLLGSPHAPVYPSKGAAATIEGAAERGTEVDHG